MRQQQERRILIDIGEQLRRIQDALSHNSKHQTSINMNWKSCLSVNGIDYAKVGFRLMLIYRWHSIICKYNDCTFGSKNCNQMVSFAWTLRYKLPFTLHCSTGIHYRLHDKQQVGDNMSTFLPLASTVTSLVTNSGHPFMTFTRFSIVWNAQLNKQANALVCLCNTAQQ